MFFMPWVRSGLLVFKPTARFALPWLPNRLACSSLFDRSLTVAARIPVSAPSTFVVATVSVFSPLAFGLSGGTRQNFLVHLPAEFIFGDLQFVIGLEVYPHGGGGSEIPPQPQGRSGGNAALALQNGSDPVGRDAQRQR